VPISSAKLAGALNDSKALWITYAYRLKNRRSIHLAGTDTKLGVPAQGGSQKLRLHPTGVGDKYIQRDRSGDIRQRQKPFTSSFRAHESCNVAIVETSNAVHKERCHKVDALRSKWEFGFGVRKYCADQLLPVESCLPFWFAVIVQRALKTERHQPLGSLRLICSHLSTESNCEPLQDCICTL